MPQRVRREAIADDIAVHVEVPAARPAPHNRLPAFQPGDAQLRYEARKRLGTDLAKLADFAACGFGLLVACVLIWQLVEGVPAIRLLREERNLTQTDLAARSQIKRSSVADIERGRHIPSIVTLDRIAESLGMRTWQVPQFADRLTLIHETPFQPYAVEMLATRKQAA